MSDDPIPIPANLEAEESLLGAMLMSRGARTAATIAGVDRTDFYKPEHGAIYTAILEAGDDVDPVIVAAHCNGAGVTSKQLVALLAATPASANAEAYALLIRSAARRRHQIKLAAQLRDAAYYGADTEAILTELVAARATEHSRVVDGRTFVLETPATIPTVWGTGDTILWAASESLEIVGPTGVGKTTLTVQLVAARIGIGDQVLGMAVAPAQRVLYLACDRPAQIRRAFARLIGPEHGDTLAERLQVWRGPPPRDFAKHPDTLLALARDARADCVIIDSLKDVAIGISDDEVGAGLNIAIQTALAEGIDICALHHQRKGQGGQRPRSLEDVYGSTWITAGAGSVILLWGEAGDPLIELTHLKQPAETVGPLKIDHDHVTGITSVTQGAVDPYTMLQNAPSGITARDLARVTHEKEPTPNQMRVARSRLDRLVARKKAWRREPSVGGDGGTEPAVYFAVVSDLGETA